MKSREAVLRRMTRCCGADGRGRCRDGSVRRPDDGGWCAVNRSRGIWARKKGQGRFSGGHFRRRHGAGSRMALVSLGGECAVQSAVARVCGWSVAGYSDQNEHRGGDFDEDASVLRRGWQRSLSGRVRGAPGGGGWCAVGRALGFRVRMRSARLSPGGHLAEHLGIGALPGGAVDRVPREERCGTPRRGADAGAVSFRHPAFHAGRAGRAGRGGIGALTDGAHDPVPSGR